MRTLAIVFICFTALGCATQYGSMDDSISGGFTETRLSPDRWRVLVVGNSLTSRGDVEQYLMRRCAELTLEQGKRYFVLDGHKAWINARPTESGIATSPANAAVLTIVSQRGRDSFDAVDVIEETNAAARGRLSDKARRNLDAVKQAAF
ncbi:MAG: hypothetical protein JWO97_1591 [Acidobacteria bacterium]|nr:hypothetical protein [Acidobacteriota bacterium]